MAGELCDRAHGGSRPRRGGIRMSDEASARRPSIRDVARLAGVSHQTVSRVLNNHPSIRPETKERVLEVMEQLQYRPNRAARALVTSRSQTIGILAAAQHAVRAGVEHRRHRGGRPGARLLGEHGEHRRRRSAVDPGRARASDGPGRSRASSSSPRRCASSARCRRALDIPYVTLQSTDLDPTTRMSVDQIAGARTGDKTPDQPGSSRDLPPRRSAGLDRGGGAHARLPRGDVGQRHPDHGADPGRLDGRVRLLRGA